MQSDVDLKWQDYASCNGIENHNLFFDDYEADVVTAINTDQLCLHCPVAKQCLEDGITHGDWGVHGGVYLVYGKIDRQRNSHKTLENWEELEQVHGRSINESSS